MRSFLIFFSLVCLMPAVVIAGGVQSTPIEKEEFYIGHDGKTFNPSAPLVPGGDSDHAARDSGSSPYVQDDPHYPNADGAWDDVPLGGGGEERNTSLPWYHCFLSCFFLPADFDE